MKVKDILDRVTTRYNDADYTRVSQSMYLSFLDDAINQLILARPDSHVKTAVVQLVPGTRQSLPADGFNLIAIYRNMTGNGNGTFSEGAPILQVEREQLDMFSDWHNLDPVTEVEQYAYDMTAPKTIWVSEPIHPTTPVYVEMDYSHGAEKYADMLDAFEEILDMTLPVDDVFLAPIVNYVLYLLFSTDTGSTGDAVLAQRYEQSFYQSLGIEYQATLLVLPKVKNSEEEVKNAAVA